LSGEEEAGEAAAVHPRDREANVWEWAKAWLRAFDVERERSSAACAIGFEH